MPLSSSIFPASFHIEVLAIPQEFHEHDTVTDGEPYWARVIDLAEENAFHALCDAIEDRCRSKDARGARSTSAGDGIKRL